MTHLGLFDGHIIGPGSGTPPCAVRHSAMLSWDHALDILPSNHFLHSL